MITHHFDHVRDTVAQAYSSSSSPPCFRDVLSLFTPEGDEQLACVIECDARQRLTADLPIDLDRYRREIPRLHDQPVALDAAIEFTLRSQAKASGEAMPICVDRLIKAHPEIAGAIRNSAIMGGLLPSTRSTRRLIFSHLEIPLPTQIGPKLPKAGRRYELREIIGYGAHGMVYLAVDRELSDSQHPASVAIKVLSSRSRRSSAHDRLMDEARIVRRIVHPGVVRVMDQGLYKGHRFFVYEHIEGGDLVRHLASLGGKLPSSDAADFVAKLCRGVQAVHASSLIHLDLKPSNILLTEQGEPKITDFGVARCLWDQHAEDPSRLTGPVGTLAYMSPECQDGGESAATTMSDVYSLGIILIELITGRTPAARSSFSPHQNHEAARRLLDEAEFNQTDRDLRAICAKAIALEPYERFTSAEAMARSLEDWIAHRPLEWISPSPLRRARLTLRRQPEACLLAALLVAALVGGTAGVIHTKASARERVLMQRNEIQKSAILEVQRALRSLHSALSGPDSEPKWLPTLISLEQLTTPLIQAQGIDSSDLIKSRILAAHTLLHEATPEDRRNAVDVLMWETMLGYWLIQDGQLNEAVATLEQNADNWARRLGEDDSWVQYVRTLTACAVARSIAKQRQANLADIRAYSPGRIERVRTQLHQGLNLFSGFREETGIHQMILESLAALPQDDDSGQL